MEEECRQNGRRVWSEWKKRDIKGAEVEECGQDGRRVMGADNKK